MLDVATSPAVSLALCEVLLGYLRAAGEPVCPGADGLTLEDALAAYPQSIVDGLVPGLQELLRLHPDLRDALLAFFAGHGSREPGPLPESRGGENNKEADAILPSDYSGA
jgi:hypothetical protein